MSEQLSREALVTDDLPFLGGGGACGALMRAGEWDPAVLPPAAEWPQSLRSVVGVLLQSRLPMFVAWGEKLALLYNDAYAEILGEKHPGALGAPFAEVWAEIWTDVSPRIEAALGGKGTYDQDLPLLMNRHGYDELTWFTFSYSPLRDDGGEIAGMFCACVETTSKVLAERRLNFLVRLSDVLRELRTPEEVQARAAQTLGEELVLDRCGYGEIVGGGAVVSVKRDWARDGVASLTREARILHAFGPQIIAEMRAGRTVVVEDCEEDPRTRQAEHLPAWRSIGVRALVVAPLLEDGELTAILYAHSTEPRRWAPDEVALVEDVAARTWSANAQAKAEAAVRHANSTLEARVAEVLAERKILADIVEGTDAFVQVADPEFRWLAVNKASADEFERIYGVRPKVGECMLEVLKDRPEHKADVERVWARALAGESFVQIAEFGDPGRDRRAYEMKYNTLRDADGRLIGAYQFVYDVTERVQEQQRLAEAEAQLRQSQKMDAIGQLTGGVAHDFNNLLTPIVAVLDRLQRNGLGGEREQRLIGAAAQSAERARVLVQRLLAFSRRQPLQAGPVDVGQLVGGMVDLIASTTGPQLQVTAETDPDLPAAVGDVNQLELALLNLAVNARDAMPNGGALRIAAAAKTIPPGHPTKLTPGCYVCISVTDTGQGMDEATRQRAVEPFFSTKGVGRGTGLGLSMVHGLALQLGGHLEIHSREGHGTTVEIWLPASEAPAREETPNVPPEPRAFSGVALLVDDEEDARVATSDMLSELGYEVTEAASADEALRLVASHGPPDVLVTDHLMPGMTGTELAHTLRAQHPAVKALVISGYAESAGLTPDLPRLTKPFRKDDMSEALGRLVSHHACGPMA